MVPTRKYLACSMEGLVWDHAGYASLGGGCMCKRHGGDQVCMCVPHAPSASSHSIGFFRSPRLGHFVVFNVMLLFAVGLQAWPGSPFMCCPFIALRIHGKHGPCALGCLVRAACMHDARGAW